MGSTAIIYGVVALALALVCLFAGFLWGRSNVKAKLEQALEQEHASLVAREYAMRQQLEDAIAELARLRPLADELGRVQDRLKHEQSKYEQMRSEFSPTLRSDFAPGEQEVPIAPPESAPVPESPDAAIQRLLQSLETLNETPEPKNIPINESQPEPSKSHVPPAPQVPQFVAKQPVAEKQPVVEKQSVVETRPAVQKQAVVAKQPDVPRMVEKTPSAPQASQPRPQAEDEWQEFARSLADLARSTQPKR